MKPRLTRAQAEILGVPDEDPPEWIPPVRAHILAEFGPAARPAVEGEIDPDVRPLADTAIPAAALLDGLLHPPATGFLPALTPLGQLPEPVICEPAPQLPALPPLPMPRHASDPTLWIWYGRRDTSEHRITVRAIHPYTDPRYWLDALPGMAVDMVRWPQGEPNDGRKHSPKEQGPSWGSGGFIVEQRDIPAEIVIRCGGAVLVRARLDGLDAQGRPVVLLSELDVRGLLRGASAEPMTVAGDGPVRMPEHLRSKLRGRA